MQRIPTDCPAALPQCPTFRRSLLSPSTVKLISRRPRRQLTPHSLSAATHNKLKRHQIIARGTALQTLLLLKRRTPLLRLRPHHPWRLLSVLPQLRLKSGTTPTWRCWARRTPSSFGSYWHARAPRLSCLLTHLGHFPRLLFLHCCTAYVLLLHVLRSLTCPSSLVLWERRRPWTKRSSLRCGGSRGRQLCSTSM